MDEPFEDRMTYLTLVFITSIGDPIGQDEARVTVQSRGTQNSENSNTLKFHGCTFELSAQEHLIYDNSERSVAMASLTEELSASNLTDERPVGITLTAHALKYMYSHTYDVVYYRYPALGFAHVVYAEYRVKQDQSAPTLEIIESFFEMNDTHRKEQFAEKIMLLQQKYPGEMVLDLRRVDL
ncbi:hypothetical protein SISNIDRAFT_467324 [Sistotremastrum niveocremeum HHB9708]|uniref:Uncharacterized protein n=1 Tax=Sistotremastrum niveocremeum HHB9708 TaxID=1314777 RepID=A0A164SR01_9AGAM|nr:hypothetical protein SISNIDRAFT_467324 [Sistotremastrum niveocremeum HHB9708]